jgi:hypothetical protein
VRPQSSALLPDESHLLERITSGLRDTERLTREWREADELMGPDEVVHVEIGRPDPQGLDTLSDHYTLTTGAPFPALLHALWSRMNGVAIYTTADATGVDHHVVCDRLSEPVLWPVNSYGDHWWETDEACHLFVVGELADCGHIALRVGGGEPAPEVVWMARGNAPFTLATSFARFLEEWMSSAFRIQSLLRRARVPGWGH